MRLIGSPNSPFVRKVRVLTLELGLDRQVTFDRVDPRDPSIDLAKHNPLKKVPTLILEDGSALFDSAVICDWLAETYDPASRMVPRGQRRWNILVMQAVAGGLLDAGVLARQETLRRVGEQSPAWITKQMDIIERSLERLANDPEWRNGDVDLGKIAVACALGWLSFRFPEHRWTTDYPELATWNETFAERPSLTATKPVV